MKHVQPSDIVVRTIKSTIDVCDYNDFAFIEKRQDKWILGLTDNPDNIYRESDVTSYFNGKGVDNIPLENYIAGWLVIQGIKFPD